MKWLHFILSHSIFVALCAAGLVLQTGQLLRINIAFPVYGLVFFATLCSYNFYWIVSRFAFTPGIPALNFIEREKTGLLLMLLSLIGLLICFPVSGISSLHLALAALLTVLYAVPLVPVKALQFTRKAGVLKTTLLAFTWAYVTAFLPLQKDWTDLTNPEIFVFTRRILFMLMLCIIFDNRDKALDKIRGLHSLATVLRPGQMLLLITIIFLILFGTNFLSVNYGITPKQSIALQTSTIALLVVYFLSTRKQGYLFYYFVVDGLMLFSALTTFVAGI